MKGNIARYMAPEVARAASQGLLTTEIEPGQFGRYWRLTPAGLDRLWFLKGMDR